MMNEFGIRDEEIEAAIRWSQEKYKRSANVTLARIVIIRIKRLYDSEECESLIFGALMREVFNELPLSPREERRKYASVAGKFFSEHTHLVRRAMRKGRHRTKPRRDRTLTAKTKLHGDQFTFNI